MKRGHSKILEFRNAAKRGKYSEIIRKGPGEEADERAIVNGCTYDTRRADHFVRFVERYATLTEGAWQGKPFTLLPWQEMSARRVFGWVRESPEWGYQVRRFRYWYIEICKKNGKTPFLATIGNYLLIGDSHRRQINLYLAATTRKQAERCLVHAIRQVRNHPQLRKSVEVKKLEGFYSMAYRDNRWDVLAADPESSDGVNGHCLADELHRWTGFEFFNSLRWMLAAQPEGLFVGITTAGSEQQSVCRTLHDKTLEIDAGRQRDDSFYGEVYAAQAEDDPHDEKVWFKANPSLGRDRKAPLKLSTFRQDYEAAKKDPTQWPTWCQMRLNLWRTGVEGWLEDVGGLAAWDAGEAARRAAGKKRIDCWEGFTKEDLQGQECYAALDGATHHDTTALVFAFPEGEQSEIVRVLPFFWLPEAEAEKQQAKVPYQAWADEGLITLTPGDAMDFRQLLRDAKELFELFAVRRFYFDPLFQAEWLTQELAEATGVEREEFPQTIMRFTAPTKAAERLILRRTLRHNGHAVLTWQMGHVNCRTDVNNNKRPIKRQRGDYRTVDGVVSLIMALADATAPPAGDYYDDHDVEWV